MRRLNALTLVALLAHGCHCGKAPAASAEETQPIGHLEFRSGAVTLERNNRRSLAELGYVFPGDQLETASGGKMRLRFAAGRLLEAGPETQVALGEGKAGILLKLARGSAVARLVRESLDGGGGVEGESGELGLQTPFGGVRCDARGGTASVQVDANSAQVQVLAGKVQVSSRAGKAIDGAAGDQFVLSSNAFERLAPAAPSATQATGANSIRMSAVAGAAEIRRSNSKKWTKLTARGDVLSETDAVRVGDGELLLELGSAQLVAANGSELNFEGGAEEPSFALLKGELIFKVEKAQRQGVSLSGLHLLPRSAGYFVLTRTPDGLELTALAGDVAFKKDGAEGKLIAGEMVTLQGAEAPVIEEMDRADLVLTSKFGVKVFHQGLDWVALAWEGGKRDYRVEVATDSGFSKSVLRGIVHRPFVNLPAPPRGTLFWRAVDLDGKMVGRGGAAFGAEPPSRDSARGRNEGAEGAEDSAPDNSVPALLIRAPKNGELVKGNRVQASGTAPVGARVLVNGKPAALDEKNRFDVSVVPVGRPPMVMFRLLRSSEPDVIVVRSLRRPR